MSVAKMERRRAEALSRPTCDRVWTAAALLEAVIATAAMDEALTTAILDRMLHKAQVINIKGRSYRLRDLENVLNGQIN